MLWSGGPWLYPFIGEKTEAQRGRMTWPRSQSQWVVEPGFALRGPWLQSKHTAVTLYYKNVHLLGLGSLCEYLT